ncbi:MAG: methionine biosynthesis protein MetW [Deltaproteobacteria bacterium]|jgi:methionine biosynthesis protein MetW|nr:methionine biosynthesis protein MetW [Deltaproteobacteria bacterium]
MADLVIVLDKDNHSLAPCSRKRARILIKKGRAKVVKQNPYTIALIDKVVKPKGEEKDPVRLDAAVWEEFTRLKKLHRNLGLLDRNGKSAKLSLSNEPTKVSPSSFPSSNRWQDKVILSGVEPGSYVLDLGCGEGELLERMIVDLKVSGQGVEVDPKAAMAAMDRGVFVLNLDVSDVLGDYEDQSFDYVILEGTLQTLKEPLKVLHEMLRVGRHGILSFPNFGYWKVRLDLGARGRMPITPGLPYGWHDTPNIHLFTLDDLMDFCRQNNVQVAAAFGLADGEIRALGTHDNLVTEEAILFLEKG